MPRSRLARLVLAGTATIATALLSSAPVMADASNWKVGYYTPSSVGTLSFAQARPGGGVASLNFTDQSNTALLVTTHGSSKGDTLGDLTGKTINARFHVSDATGAFTYYGEGTPSNPCGTPAASSSRPTTGAVSLSRTTGGRTLCLRSWPTVQER